MCVRECECECECVFVFVSVSVFVCACTSVRKTVCLCMWLNAEMIEQQLQNESTTEGATSTQHLRDGFVNFQKPFNWVKTYHHCIAGGILTRWS